MSEAGLRVLLVEDDRTDRKLIVRALQARDGVSVTIEHAGTVEEARAAMLAGPFDCVLVDFHLPDGDALALLRGMGPRDAAPPIIVLTGADDEITALHALNLGAQDYLLKDRLQSDLLMRSVRYAIERMRVQRALEQANAQLGKLAFLDPLTETLNRRGLEHLLLAEQGRAIGAGQLLFGMLLDCDDFKRINDTYGHATGDLLLREVAYRIRASVRRDDHVARVGGDEFLVLMGAPQPDEALGMAEHIRRAVGRAEVRVGAKSVRATVSAGVFAVPLDARSVTDLLVYAHDALRTSKRAGKDRVSFTEGSPDAQALGRVTGLLEPGGLRVVHQPIVRLADEARVGIEMLVRGPAGDLETPAELLRHGFETGVLTELDLRCLDACVGAAALEDTRVHVNLCWSTLSAVPPAALLARLTRGRPPSQCCIELDALQLAGDPSRFAPAVAALREAGVQFALEDAAAEYGCLEALVVLRPAFVKFDRAAVIEASRGGQASDAIERMVRTARALGAETVAVGIESNEVLDLLRRAGVTYGQGFVWGQPTALDPS